MNENIEDAEVDQEPEDLGAGEFVDDVKSKEKAKKQKSEGVEVKRPGVVVSGGDTDPVHLSMCIYKNAYQRKSLSIHHVQRRLVELGYRDAGSDKDGWFGEPTRKSVMEFQEDRNIVGVDGLIDEKTLELLFAGDPHVTVVL